MDDEILSIDRTAYLMCCMCDVTADDMLAAMIGGKLCKTHNAVKLQSIVERLNVSLLFHHIDEAGDLRPLTISEAIQKART